jgi:hypothetical protein
VEDKLKVEYVAKEEILSKEQIQSHLASEIKKV